jgi:hypothetical protein
LFWLVVAPFTAMPRATAFVAWTIVSLGTFAAAVYLASRHMPLRSVDTAIVTLALTGTAFEFALGQVASLLALPFTAAWIAMRHERTARAAAWLSLLAVLKPFFVLFALPMIVRRDWRALGIFVSGLAALSAIGFYLAGAANYLAWFRNLTEVSWTWHIFNSSVWGTAARLFDHQQVAIAAAWTPLTFSPLTARLLGVSASVLVAVLLVTQLREADADQTFALTALASLLISPLGWNYYLATIFAPVLNVLCRRPSAWFWPVGVAAVCPYALLVNRRYGPIGTLTVGQISMFVCASLFLLVATDRARKARIDETTGSALR